MTHFTDYGALVVLLSLSTISSLGFKSCLHWYFPIYIWYLKCVFEFSNEIILLCLSLIIYLETTHNPNSFIIM